MLEFKEMQEIFKEYQQVSNPYDFMNDTMLEWQCVNDRENEDGSKMYIMETTDSKFGFTFGEYNAKCEYMYNLHIL